jgi:hypothetical protein
LRDGDEIVVGRYRLHFLVQTADAETVAAPRSGFNAAG